MDSNVVLPCCAKLSKPRFETNERFQKQGNFFNDSAFFRINKSKRQNRGQRMNSDGLSAFLQGQTDGLDISSIDKLAGEELSYSDLASLTDTDLELMGFKHRKERENLLKFFAELPNQDPTFDELCDQPDAQQYNSSILANANKHLDTMKHCLNEANFKLLIKTPDDVLVGDKYFASHFLVEALDELNLATNGIENELEEMSKVLSFELKKRKKRKFSKRNWCLITLAGVAAVTAFWLMKSQQ